MREILFRGKRYMDGEWVDGSLFIDEKKEKHEILVGYVNFRYGWEVDPVTVGQFTGMTDKNGKKIFEGDIVEISGQRPYVVEFINGGFEPFVIKGWECEREADEYEIIGNIHDNPELLKGGEK